MPFVTCPECRAESSAPRDLIGLEWDCPKCGAPFVVTEDDSPVPVRRRRKKNSFPVAAVAVIGVMVVATLGFGIAVLKRASAPPQKVQQKAPAVAPAPREPDRFVPVGNAEVSDAYLTAKNLFLLAVLTPIYLLPSVVAVLRKHNNLAPIIVVNILLGCIFVGWVVALAWSLTDLKPHRQSGPV